MKVIFLDIDGVLNCESTQELVPGTVIIGIDQTLLYNLTYVVSWTDACIILSSSWRLMRDRYGNTSNRIYKYLEDKLASTSIPILDQIDNDISESYRGQLIKRWLDNHEVESFLILDDDEFDYAEQGLNDNWIHTNYETGFTRELIADAIKILEKNEDVFK